MQLRRFNSTRPLQGHEQEERPHEMKNGQLKPGYNAKVSWV